jgi:LPS-assembly protein
MPPFLRDRLVCAVLGCTFLLGALCGTLLVVAAARAESPQQSPLIEAQEVNIDAEQISFDQKTDTVVARGQVVVRRGETELRADEVSFNRTTHEADARGAVTLTDTEGTIQADALHLNLDEETGIVENAEVQLRRNHYSVWGDVLEKGAGMSFHIENGKFTTCRCGDKVPSWSVSGEELAVTLGGYGTLKSGTFNILDVPVLYIPRAVFPMQVERQSGFLMPQFGVSNRRGFQMLAPFYWAINKSQDATIAFDLETNARIGLVGEYRYILDGGARGIWELSYFNDVFSGPETTPFPPSFEPNRFSVVGQHVQPLGDQRTRAFVDAFLVSDDQFLRDINTYAFQYGLETSIRTKPYTKSLAGVVHEWDQAAVKADGVFYQDLTGTESLVPQRAPQIDTWGQTSVDQYLLADVSASGVNFVRTQDVAGFRLDVEPSVTVPIPLGEYAFGAVRAAGRETGYFLSETDVTGGTLPGTPSTLPANQSREIGEVRGAVGTALDRIYSVDWLGIEKLKHTIEPMVEYLYVPDVSQIDQPLWDGVDRINQRNLFTYGVQTRFVGKFADSVAVEPGTDVRPAGTAPIEKYRELARFSLMQSVDASREITPLQSGAPADHFSDIDFAARINPARTLSVRFGANYDTSNNNLSAATVGFFFDEPWSPYDPTDRQHLQTRTSAGVSYRFITNNLLQEVDSNVVVRLTDWAGFLYASRYDVVTSQFLGSYYGMRFISTCDCWALDIAVDQKTNPQEVEVRAQITLVGLGSGMPPPRVAYMP